MSLEKAVYEWASARATRLSAERTLLGFTCEDAHRGSGEPDDPGQPRCYHGGSDVPDWCSQCQHRERLYPGFVLLKAAERRAFRRMERQAMRLKREHDQPLSVNAGATPVAEGATESAQNSSSFGIATQKEQP